MEKQEIVAEKKEANQDEKKEPKLTIIKRAPVIGRSDSQAINEETKETFWVRTCKTCKETKEVLFSNFANYSKKCNKCHNKEHKDYQQKRNKRTPRHSKRPTGPDRYPKETIDKLIRLKAMDVKNVVIERQTNIQVATFLSWIRDNKITIPSADGLDFEIIVKPEAKIVQ